MGKDIAYVFQRKDATQWVDISSKYDGMRDYQLFYWLGFFWGNCDDLEPISELRGLPDDFEIDSNSGHPTEIKDGVGFLHDGKIFFINEHNSWLLSSEILADRPLIARRRLIYDKKCYLELEADGGPFWSCNFNSDPGPPEKITIDDKDAILEFNYNYSDDFEYFINEVRRLQSEYGEVRFVFGFY